MSNDINSQPSDAPPLQWIVWLAEPDSEAEASTLEIASTSGKAIFKTDAENIESRDDLVEAISVEFLVPFEIRGLDAVLSVLSDLEWLPNESGYLWALSGMG